MRRIGLSKLFSKKADKKPTAAVFVDYEHWYISITKLHGVKPNIKGWMKEITRKYDIKDISFFGDFSNPSLAAEILRIRAVTNNIIQTSNTGNYKKDFTDFIMLDHIYQKAMFSHDIDTFIIFSGDGHFSSAASCLKNNCGKEVGIFGVKDAFSNQLKEIASWFEEVPTVFDIYEKYFDMIFTNIKDVERTGRSIRPSFAKTVEHVSELYGVPEDKIKEALNVLINKGYTSRKESSFGKKRFMVLDFDWDKIEADEIWVKDRNLKRKEQDKNDSDKVLDVLSGKNEEKERKQKQEKEKEKTKTNEKEKKQNSNKKTIMIIDKKSSMTTSQKKENGPKKKGHPSKKNTNEKKASLSVSKETLKIIPVGEKKNEEILSQKTNISEEKTVIEKIPRSKQKTETPRKSKSNVSEEKKDKAQKKEKEAATKKAKEKNRKKNQKIYKTKNATITLENKETKEIKKDEKLSVKIESINTEKTKRLSSKNGENTNSKKRKRQYYTIKNNASKAKK